MHAVDHINTDLKNSFVSSDKYLIIVDDEYCYFPSHIIHGFSWPEAI